MVDPALCTFRVDARLVHASLVNAWVPRLRPERILVVDDATAKSPRLRTIFEMSAMDTAEVAFTTVAQADRELSKSGNARVVVLFPCLETAERAVDHELPVGALMIGHVPEGPGRVEVHPSVFLGEPERAVIDRLEDRGIQIWVQPLPDDPRLAPVPAAGARHTTKSELFRPNSAIVKPAPRVASTPPARLKEIVEVVNERGLHLRAAHVLAQLASRLPASIEVGFPGAMVNAKSLLGLTTLGAARGAKLWVVASGAGAEGAMRAIRELFANGFEEGPG